MPGCLAALVAVAILFGGCYVAATKGVELLTDQLASRRGLPRPGHGKVVFEVEKGDTIAADGPQPQGQGRGEVRGRVHRRRHDEPDSTGIQVGYYQLRRRWRPTTR